MKRVDIIGLSVIAMGAVLCFLTLLWGIILIIIGIGVCSFYTIPQGYYGYILLLEKNIGKAHSNGWGLKIPLLSSVINVSAEPYTHTEQLQIQNAMNDNTGITYTLTFKFKKDCAHQLKERIHSLSQKEYAERFLCKPIGQALGDICATKTNDELNTQRSAIAKEALDKLALDRFIEIIALSIGENFKYSEATEKANEQLAAIAREKKIVEAQDAIIEKKGQQLVKTAGFNKEARIKDAEGEAQAMSIKGASENAIKERLGEILKAHPELLKEILAKNFPKVFGGNTIINLDDLLGK